MRKATPDAAAETSRDSSTPIPTVVIVGCGPTGATAAIQLAQRGINVLVLERWGQPYGLPRAVHFDDEVFRIFADLGIADAVRSISRPAPGMQLVDADLRVLATLRRDPHSGRYGFPQANMFDQPELERVLRERMTQLPQISLRTGVEVIGVEHPDNPSGQTRTAVHLRRLADGGEETVLAHAVLGCDGANSTVRTIIGAELESLGFEQQWMVIDVTSPAELDVYDGVQQVCDHDRAATFMMVTRGRYRWEFRLRPCEVANEISHQDVLELIAPWLGGVDPGLLTIQRRAWYTFRGAVADRWWQGRTFLLGDAAHLTPPFIGQGMCAGIRDAANLTWKLALVLQHRADERLLTTYQEERQPYARHVIKLAIGVGWLMTGGSACTSAARRALLRAACLLPGVENHVVNSAMPTLPRGPLTAPNRPAGALIPQPTISGTGDPILLDKLLGPGFAIVTNGNARPDRFEPALRRWFESLGITYVELTSADALNVFGQLPEVPGAALLVRPDRTIAATADRLDLRTWRELLTQAGINGIDHTERQID